MRHLFLINPGAGQPGSTDALCRRIAADMAGRDYAVELSRGAGDVERLARQAAETGEAVRIYACGGDGTLNEAVNGAAGFPNAAVTNVPKGTGNDFLRIFGDRARFSDLEALAEGPRAEFDLMDCNGRLGIGVVCAGVDARVAADVHRYKALPLVGGTGAYVLSLAVNVLFRRLTRPVDLRMGPHHLTGENTLICICNGRYYGGGFMPVGEAQPDDGVLDVLAVPRVSRLTFARLVGAYAKGRYRDYPRYIVDWHGDRVDFSSPEELVAVVDGEVMRACAFTVRLSEKKVNFFYPPGLSWRRGAQPEQGAELALDRRVCEQNLNF